MKIEQPPQLAIDKILHSDDNLTPGHVLERRIVWNLMRHLEAAGFKVYQTFDSDNFEYPEDKKAAMEFIFNLDEVSLRFLHKDASVPKRPTAGKCREDYEDGDWHGVLLVLGNEEYVISDWNYFSDDRDGFDAAMNAFNVAECY